MVSNIIHSLDVDVLNEMKRNNKCSNGSSNEYCISLADKFPPSPDPIYYEYFFPFLNECMFKRTTTMAHERENNHKKKKENEKKENRGKISEEAFDRQ